MSRRRLTIPRILAVTVMACGAPQAPAPDAGARADAGRVADAGIADAGPPADAGPCATNWFDCTCCGSVTCESGFECQTIGRPDDAGVCACV